MPPKVYFCYRCFVQLNSNYKIQMYEEVNFRNCYLNGFGWFLPSDLDLWPQNTGFLCYPGWMCRPSLRKVPQGVLELLNGKGFETFDPSDLDIWPSYPKINRVPLLARMDVWTKFEEVYVKVFSGYWSETVLTYLTLTFDLNIIRIPLLPRTDEWTKFEEGTVLQLLIGNEKVRDRPTDRPTCTKQCALSSLKGGIKRGLNLIFIGQLTL